MTEENHKTNKNMVRVVYSHYDYKTRSSELRYGDAVIEADGSATIQLNMFGVLKRKAGEYLIADQFQHEWKLCIKKRAEEMAQEIIKDKRGN